jgi:hypothetical protein
MTRPDRTAFDLAGLAQVDLERIAAHVASRAGIHPAFADWLLTPLVAELEARQSGGDGPGAQSLIPPQTWHDGALGNALAAAIILARGAGALTGIGEAAGQFVDCVLENVACMAASRLLEKHDAAEVARRN